MSKCPSHILENRIPVDISLLCDFMDHLCGRLILTIRQQSSGTLHDVTLPKSWLESLVPDAKTLQSKGRQLWSMYKKNMGDLLEQIYTGTDAGRHIVLPRMISRQCSFLPQHIFCSIAVTFLPSGIK